jgi:hypothetical protein
VRLPAGTTHLWDIPPGLRRLAIVIRGNAAARVVFLNRAGRLISDRELIATKEIATSVPEDAETLAVTCLGVVPASLDVKPAPGAVTVAFAPAGGYSAAGWQVGNSGDMVSASTILARGRDCAAPTSTRVAASPPNRERSGRDLPRRSS